ncbi:hypothetical protein P5673_031310 [Acropora cervicornis]|uniref:Uncharacterized protein n=1 Tax=Acropora cervicornis TaxID=6130 RepID=A0AAD9UT00_ACRCE|nr:hypothetical protein P5673_031310 [Acropora cervicornis]
MSICSSTPQAHRGYTNSSLLESDLKMSESHANVDNKHRLEDECTDFSLNTSRNGVGEVSKRSRSKSKFSCKYGGARRDREPSRLQCDIELNPGV